VSPWKRFVMSRSRQPLPVWIVYAVVLAVVLSWVPLAIVARARTTVSEARPLHPFLDMDQQPRFGTQAEGPTLESGSPLFPDRRAMRPPVPGTVARGRLDTDSHLHRGLVGGQPAGSFPPGLSVTRELLQRGRERFDISCSPCHGAAGYGDGLVSRRADRLGEGTWTPPSSLHTDLVRSRPVGHLYNTITNGIRNMPAYGRQVAVLDRWAIVAYVKALQRSQNASLADVPGEARGLIQDGGGAR